MALLQKFFSLVRFPLRSYSATKRSLLHTYKNHLIKLLPSKTPANEEWHNIREQILQSPFVNARSDAAIMELCMGLNNSETAISFYKFLRKNNFEIDEAIAGKYLQALTYVKKALTEDDKEDIKRIYRDLKKQNVHITTKTILYLIQALCLTDDWMKACTLLENIYGSKSIKEAYSAIILAALRHDCIDLMFEYFTKCYSIEFNLMYSEDIHDEYIRHAEQKNAEEYKKLIEKMFQFWYDFTIIPTDIILNKYIKSCKKFGWMVTKTQISNRGICKNCSGCLSKLNISDTEYEVLKRVIVDKLFLFENGNLPEITKELSTFRKFIARVEHYDIVIDGLNIMYKNKNSNWTDGLLKIIINQFIEKGYSVLLIGRKHMIKIHEFRKIRDKAFVFLVENDTADDPFILYAALASGPDTKFLSCDLMRTYRNQLPNARLKRIFELWQLSRQYVWNDETWQAEHPVQFRPSAVRNNHWHLACANYELGNHDYDYVLQWYCVQPLSEAQ